MVARRRHVHKRKTTVSKGRTTRPLIKKETSPGYMVQLTEANLLRRDLLETLREVILFMQSYEKFKRIQEEKIHYFSELRADLKELNLLINNKLSAHFPKGKLHAITGEDEHREEEAEHALDDGPIRSESISMAPQVRAPRMSSAKTSSPVEDSKSELDQLEDQLRDIESQLKGIQ